MSSFGAIHFGNARHRTAHADQPVHLVVTSPPYWSIKDYGTTGQIGSGSSYEDYLTELGEVWSECWNRLLPGCRMCINIGDQFLRAKEHGRYRVLPIRQRIIEQMDALGADYMGAIIWRKMTNTNTSGGGTMMGSYPNPRNGILKIDYEFILIFKKPGKAPRPTAEQKANSIMSVKEWSQNFTAHWDFPGERQRGHHAMFPKELPRRLIRMFSFPGEYVLDPFAGGGTTIAVALEEGRKAEGIEINRDFESVIRDRLGKHAEAVRFTGEGERAQPQEESADFYGSATRLADLGRSRWEGTGKVEAIEGPITLRVGGRSWRLEGLADGTPECRKALEALVGNKRVIVEPTDETHAYIRLLNRTMINSRLIRMGVASVDPDRKHRNRTRFIRYGLEHGSKARR